MSSFALERSKQCWEWETKHLKVGCFLNTSCRQNEFKTLSSNQQSEDGF